MHSFQDLAASRRNWISTVLIPWCRQATQADLREAEFDWINIAGRVDPAMTLWTWAWGRFPALVHEGMPGLNETLEVRLTTKSGDTWHGYPDARESCGPRLVLLVRGHGGLTDHSVPLMLDDVAHVELVDPDAAPHAGPLLDRPVTTLPPSTPDDERV